MVAGIRAALDLGSVSPELVALHARHAATNPVTTPATGTDDSAAADADVIALPARQPDPDAPESLDDPDATGLRARLAGLPGERPLPSVAHYDQLLSGPQPPPPGEADPAPSAG